MELPCLPLIQERYMNEVRKHIPDLRYAELEMRMFPQAWGSTALGFRGVGGQAMTSAYTTVVTGYETGWCAVFFRERLAYCIHNPAQEFFEDMKKERMASVAEHGKYIRKD